MSSGIKQTLVGLPAGQNYVDRPVIGVESDGRGEAMIRIYDETNGATIVNFYGPRYVGQHTGANNSATLSDAGARWPLMLVGWTVYNISDGSSATITAINGAMDTITAALSGGTDDDWDTNDEYRIVPPNGPSEYDDYPWIETFTFELPTIARNGAAADCASISTIIFEMSDGGVLKISQIECLPNKIDNPSLETGAGNPYIPDGWTNVDLDAGDTTDEVTIVHSGGHSLEFAVGASDEGIKIQITAAIDDFVHVGMWSYCDGSAGFTIGGLNATQMRLHSSASSFSVATPHDAVWMYTEEVFRVVAANPEIYILADSGASGARYIDDIVVY